MSLTHIKSNNINEEKQIQNSIYSLIDKKESLIFQSGAGSGKTYSLIQSLKYVLKNYGDNLKRHNQEIMCITYTNVATKEVRMRLGRNDLVKVSTIHERIWELIKDYQIELVNLHKIKLEEEIDNLIVILQEDKKFMNYQVLNESEQKDFLNILVKIKSCFYQYSLVLHKTS